MKTNTWHILGAGAIGGLFACRLQASGINVTLCSREQASKEQTIVLRENNELRSHHFVCQPTTELSPITHLLLTTKSFDAEEALTSVAHRLDQHSMIVVMMNGMNHVAALPEIAPNSQFIFGSTTAGCHRSDNCWIPAGLGQTILGTLDKTEIAPGWFEQWLTAIPYLTWSNDIEERLIEKVAVNACINPLTAVKNIRNGQLLAAEHKEDLDEVIGEVETILRLIGREDIASNLYSRVYQVVHDTAENLSSMATDIRNQRRTEANEILGWLLDTVCPETKTVLTPRLLRLNERLQLSSPAR